MSCGCCICRGPMVLCQNNETHDTISATGCGHTFHSLCLQEWLAISMTCPKCRLAVEDSCITKKLYFDDFASDQHDPAIINAELYSLKVTIDHLKKSISESNHECELAKFQRTLMKTKLINMNLEIREMESLFNSVARDTLKVASIWRKSAVSRGKWMDAMCFTDAKWEKNIAEMAKIVAKCEQLSADQEPEMTDKDNTSWELINSLMTPNIYLLRLRLNEMEDCYMWLLGELEKGEAILKTTKDLHQSEMEQAKQLQQMTQRENNNLKAEIKSELKTRMPNAKHLP